MMEDRVVARASGLGRVGEIAAGKESDEDALVGALATRECYRVKMRMRQQQLGKSG